MPYGRIKDQTGDIGLYGFTGQEPDASTGLLHFLQRYLDVESGRWISPDLLFAIADVGAMNRFGESATAYNYVAGNPIGSVDPSGAAKSTKSDHNTRLQSKRAGQKSAVMVDGHLSNKVAGAGDKKTNGTVNFSKITNSSVKNKISGSTALADADMYMTHSAKGTVGGKKKGDEISAKKISVKHYSEKSKSMDSKRMTPKEFANHLTHNKWGKDQLVLASCWSGTPDYPIGAVKSAFAGHLAQELSGQIGGTITIIAPDATVGVSEGSGEFYTFELGSTSKKEGDKAGGFANWNVFQSTGGGAPTMLPMANWEGRSQVAGF
jgi:RHS repeat-associated protein